MLRKTAYLIAVISLLLTGVSTQMIVAANNVFGVTTVEQAPDYYSEEYQSQVRKTNRAIDSYVRSKQEDMSTQSGGGKRLAVPLYKQEKTYTCGVACAQMALKYVTDVLYTQSHLEEEIEVVSSEGAIVWKITRTLNDKIGATAYQHVKTNEANFGNSLLYSIDHGIPVISQVIPEKLPTYTDEDIRGHYVLCIGYEWFFQGTEGYSNVTYHDPHYKDVHFGTYTVSVSEMVEVINDNQKWYIRAKQ